MSRSSRTIRLGFTRGSRRVIPDRATIERDLAAPGFSDAEVETVAKESRSRSAREVAIAYCQGTQLRTEIEERDPSLLGDAIAVAVRR